MTVNVHSVHFEADAKLLEHIDKKIVKLVDHWDLHWRLCERFEQVVKHCRKVGATVVLECPLFCSYCHATRVSQFLKAMKFK
jgi:hypothetical protein